MRLRSLEVESFRAVRSARLTFGRGLNVLYGPNDLGKSTLAEAIRAAFLVPITAARAKDFVSWGGVDSIPRVVVTFDESGAVWRVEKSFGSDRRAQVALARSDDNGAKFVSVAKGREVDGKLQDLLSWGILPPGGRGAAPRRETYLATALLGRQGAVDAIFEASLKDDAHDSGRSLVTRALDALGQDPVVSRLLERLRERTGEAFTASGRHRQSAGAPLAKLRAQLTEREARLNELEETVRKGKEIQDRVCTLLAERDGAVTQRDQARALVAGLRQRAEAARRRRERQDSVDARRKDLDRIVVAETTLEKARKEHDEAAETVRKFDEDHQREDEAARGVEQQARGTHEQLAGAKAANDKAHELARSALEQSRAELEARVVAGNARAQAARDALAAARTANGLRMELATARDQLADAEEDVESAALLERAATVLAEQGRALGLIATAQAADVARANEAAAEQRAAEAVEDSEKSYAAAQAMLDGARVALADARRAGEERELRNTAIRTALLQAEAAEGDARQAVARIKDAVDRVARTADAERSFTETESRERDVESQLDANAQEATQCEAEHRLLSAVSLHLRRRVLSEQIDALSHEEERAHDMRGRAADARRRASRLETDSARRRLPTDEGVAALSALASEITRFGTTSPEPVAMPVVLPLLLGVLVSAVVMIGCRAGEVAAPVASAIGAGVGLIAAALSAALGLRSRRAAAEQSWRSTHDRLEARWRDEAAPVLRDAGVRDIEALAPACQAAVNERLDIERLRDEAMALDRNADAAVAAAAALASLRRERDGVAELLSGQDEHTLDDAAAPFAVDRTALTLRIGRGRTRSDDLRSARERLLEERNRTASLREAARTRADSLRSERDQALAVIGDPTTALAAAERRSSTARDEAERIRGQLASFEQSGVPDIAEHEARVRAAQDTLAGASRAVEARRRERDAAADTLAGAGARHEIAIRAAEGAELLEIERRAAAAVSEAGIDPAHVPTPDDAKREYALAKERGGAQATAVNTLAGRLADANARADDLASKLGADAAEVLATAEAEIAAAQAALKTLGTLSSDTIAEAARKLREATEAARKAEDALTEAKRRLDEATQSRDTARATRDRAHGELETRRRDVEGMNRATAEAELTEALAALEATPPAKECAPGEVEAAQRQLEACEHELEHREGDLREARGKLDVVGGPDAADKLDDEKEALERARVYASDQELEYGASFALQQALESVDAKRASHLGRVLAKPVTERFLALTGNRYSQLTLDPDLRAEGIGVAGADRKIEELSVGTREQLATLIRLAIAAQIKTAVLLDDQLVHSDAWRLEWFRERLRTTVREHDHQVIVLTCRPTDYVAESEMPAAGSGRRDSSNEWLAIVDLSGAMTRV